jgi:hypothetical protein
MKLISKLTHISAGIDFWAYVDRDFFAHLNVPL